MGWRMSIDMLMINNDVYSKDTKYSDLTIVGQSLFYGTKLYGYYDRTFLSFEYLKHINKVDLSEPYQYCNFSVLLDREEFEQFINYYRKDYYEVTKCKLEEIDDFEVVLDSLENQNVIGYYLEWC